MKNKLKHAIPIILGVIMLAGAVGHLVVPREYAPMIPAFIPQDFANIMAAIAEGLVAFGLFIPKYRKYGGLGFMGLMFVFLPIHVWDLVREEPYLGSATAAYLRLVVQFLFIYAGWWIYKTSSTLPSDQSPPPEPQ
ncbi:MAG: DoxX family membrane protein [Salibacteraceae bacterium]